VAQARQALLGLASSSGRGAPERRRGRLGPRAGPRLDV